MGRLPRPAVEGTLRILDHDGVHVDLHLHWDVPLFPQRSAEAPVPALRPGNTDQLGHLFAVLNADLQLLARKDRPRREANRELHALFASQRRREIQVRPRVLLANDIVQHYQRFICTLLPG